MLLRYIIVLVLVYLLIRLVRSALADFIGGLRAGGWNRRTNGNNVSGEGKKNLADIEDVPFEEIKDDADNRRN
jgi:hypothetical protein